jgi:uncharacterized protein YegL
MKKDYVEIALILDKSGSMTMLREQVVNGFNDFIKEQKETLKDKNVKFTLILFDHNYEVKYQCINLQEVNELKYEEYTTSGLTALLDAIGKTTFDFGERFNKMKDSEKPEKVIIAIMTDGEENNSKEYSNKTIKAMIKEQEDKYNWTFLFLSSDISSIDHAKHLYGIKDQNIALYAQTIAGYHGDDSSFKRLSKTVVSRVSGDNDTAIKSD